MVKGGGFYVLPSNDEGKGAPDIVESSMLGGKRISHRHQRVVSTEPQKSQSIARIRLLVHRLFEDLLDWIGAFKMTLAICPSRQPYRRDLVPQPYRHKVYLSFFKSIPQGAPWPP